MYDFKIQSDCKWYAFFIRFVVSHLIFHCKLQDSDMKIEPKKIDPKIISNFNALFGKIANRRSNMIPIYNKDLGQEFLSEGDLLHLIKINEHDYCMISTTDGIFKPNGNYLFVNVVSSPLEIYCINDEQINTRLEMELSLSENSYMPVGHTSMTYTERYRKTPDILRGGRKSYHISRYFIAATGCAFVGENAYSEESRCSCIRYCDDVYLAGTLKFERGRLIEWTLGSGHYRVDEKLKQSNKIPYLEYLLPDHLYKTWVPE